MQNKLFFLFLQTKKTENKMQIKNNMTKFVKIFTNHFIHIMGQFDFLQHLFSKEMVFFFLPFQKKKRTKKIIVFKDLKKKKFFKKNVDLKKKNLKHEEERKENVFFQDHYGYE
jgi:hypothetical protein